MCHKPLDIITTEYDHGKAWADGGKTLVKNGQALHADCHKRKTHEEGLKKLESKKKKKKNPPKRNTQSDPLSDLLGESPKRSKKDPFGLGF